MQSIFIAKAEIRIDEQCTTREFNTNVQKRYRCALRFKRILHGEYPAVFLVAWLCCCPLQFAVESQELDLFGLEQCQIEDFQEATTEATNHYMTTTVHTIIAHCNHKSILSQKKH